ncbi:MAG: HAMP domain-containing histidine kinase [Clostridiales bacterium]|nr:HAMP domain-containing histidine kinase [Clostridiales bacterium]
MFNKTIRKIVFTVVFSLLALMLVTLTTIYVSNRITLDNDGRRMLQTFAERYSLEGEQGPQTGEMRPEDKPDFKPDETGEGREPRDDGRMKNEEEFQLSTFYSVAFSKEGEVIAVDSGNSNLQSEDSLVAAAESILKKGSKSGKTGNVIYLVEERENYTLVAMLDQTINDRNQTLLFRQMLIIGSIALIVLVVLSVFIARRIVHPLEENDKRQKRFVSDAGHELKTPIAVISANSELLKRELGDNEWLSNIDYENEKMSNLVKQLLTLSRAESGEVPKEETDFSRLVEGEVLPFESLAYEKGKKIESDIEQGIVLDGNPGQLRQLVSILLDNALSHGTGDKIQLSLRKEHHSAVLSVSNESDEISEEQLKHLFERFYRTDESRSDSESHYGLGLSIAKAVTEAHGGEIRAEYKDRTVTFKAILPTGKKSQKN